MFEVLNHYTQQHRRIGRARVWASLNTATSWSAPTARRTSSRPALSASFSRRAQRGGRGPWSAGHRLHTRALKAHRRRGVKFHAGVRLMKPLGFLDYVRLQRSARAVLSDSGTITERVLHPQLPGAQSARGHERPEGMEEASVMMTGLSVERVRQALPSWPRSHVVTSAACAWWPTTACPMCRTRSCASCTATPTT